MKAAKSGSGYFYGYAWDIRMAWRRESAEAPKDYTADLRCLPGDTFPTAYWGSDSSAKMITAVTCEELTAAADRQEPKTGPFWSGRHTDGEMLRVVRKLSKCLFATFWPRRIQALRL